MFCANQMWTYRWVWWKAVKLEDTTEHEVKKRQNGSRRPVDQTHFSTNLNHRLENLFRLVRSWHWILNYLAAYLFFAMQCSSFGFRNCVCQLKFYLLFDLDVLLPWLFCTSSTLLLRKFQGTAWVSWIDQKLFLSRSNGIIIPEVAFLSHTAHFQLSVVYLAMIALDQGYLFIFLEAYSIDL